MKEIFSRLPDINIIKIENIVYSITYKDWTDLIEIYTLHLKVN